VCRVVFNLGSLLSVHRPPFAGVSGVGYAYPDEFSHPEQLGALTALTAAYMAKGDLRIVNVLGHGEGYTDAEVSPYTQQAQVCDSFRCGS
jgi:hypothetical protein